MIKRYNKAYKTRTPQRVDNGTGEDRKVDNGEMKDGQALRHQEP
jgi:hypothetical protein